MQQELVMKSNQSQSRIGGSILAFSLLFGIGIALSTTAQAQNTDDRDAQDRYRNDNGDQNRRGRNWDGYGNYGGSFELRQTALNAGYNEGIKEGRKDGEKGRRTDSRNQSTYQKATKDYSSRLGDRELYRRYFREAFENGYNDGGYGQSSPGRDDRYRNRDRNDNGAQNRRGRNWDGYGNYGGSFELRQTALNAGYNEGVKEGRNDRKRGRHSDYRDFSAYQKATHDYSSKLGDRELYRLYFGAAFENGYGAGYNGY
jgi:hypothetical protein